MKLSVPIGVGGTIEFECADTLISRWVSRAILEGDTYPQLPFLDDVRVVFDVGANCGAASVWFAHHYPQAQVHAFEPASEPRAYLERNAAARPNIHVHPVGLHAIDQEVALYHGDGDSGYGSVFRRWVNLPDSEQVTLRNGDAWAAEHGIDRIDVLKVDVEGCEVEVASGLAELLPTVQALYVEYDSRRARRDLDRLLEGTHDLLVGMMTLDQGECIYLHRGLADRDAAADWLRERFATRLRRDADRSR